MPEFIALAQYLHSIWYFYDNQDGTYTAIKTNSTGVSKKFYSWSSMINYITWCQDKNWEVLDLTGQINGAKPLDSIITNVPDLCAKAEAMLQVA